jgi:hypothetical protein
VKLASTFYTGENNALIKLPIEAGEIEPSGIPSVIASVNGPIAQNGVQFYHSAQSLCPSALKIELVQCCKLACLRRRARRGVNFADVCVYLNSQI